MASPNQTSRFPDKEAIMKKLSQPYQAPPGHENRLSKKWRNESLSIGTSTSTLGAGSWASIYSDRVREPADRNPIPFLHEPNYEDEVEELWQTFLRAIGTFPQLTAGEISHFFDLDIEPEEMRDALGEDWGGLFDYQQDGICILMAAEDRRLGNFTGAILADGMGLGKTAQIIGLLLLRRDDKPALIACPASLVDHWTSELKKFANPPFRVLEYRTGHTKADILANEIVIVSYDTLRNEFRQVDTYMTCISIRDAKPHPQRKPWPDSENHIALHKPTTPLFFVHFSRKIGDEAHWAKNHKSLTHKAFHHIWADSCIPVTGTPLNNSYEDIYSLFKLLRVAPLDNLAFFREYFVARAKGDKKIYSFEVRDNEFLPMDHARNAVLHLILWGLTIRRTRDFVYEGRDLRFNMPQVSRRTVPIPLDSGNVYDVQATLPDVERSSEVAQIYALVDEFFQWATSDQASNLGDGHRFGRELMGFVPRNERDLQFATRIHWCTKLRTSIAQDNKTIADAYPMPIKGSPTSLSDMSKARLGAIHWALGLPTNFSFLSTYTRHQVKSWARQNGNYRSSKIDWVIKYVSDQLEADPFTATIVVCQSVKALDILSVGLEIHHIPSISFDGDCDRDEKAALQREFQYQQTPRSHVMLLSIKAGGVGLDLSAASCVIHLGSQWNPFDELQAEARADRPGMLRELEILSLIADCSMDWRCETRKQAKGFMGMGLLDLYQTRVTTNSLEASDPPSDVDSDEEDPHEAHWTAVKAKVEWNLNCTELEFREQLQTMRVHDANRYLSDNADEDNDDEDEEDDEDEIPNEQDKDFVVDDEEDLERYPEREYLPAGTNRKGAIQDGNPLNLSSGSSEEEGDAESEGDEDEQMEGIEFDQEGDDRGDEQDEQQFVDDDDDTGLFVD